METKEKRRRRGRTKAQREKDWAMVLEKLKNTPEDQLSPVAKYWLNHEHDEPVKLNMRYVMK